MMIKTKRAVSKTVAILCLGLAGLAPAFAANLLTNPGFEAGQSGWGNPNAIRGGTSIVISDPALARTGNNCISNFNATGWSSAYQGDSAGGWSTGVSLPVSELNFYKLSAWVKVPGASTNPQPVTLRYRFEPSGARVDVGMKTISTEEWTLLETEWIQPPAGSGFMSYWEVHTLNNGVLFFADDCGLEEGIPVSVQGKVTQGGAGVDNANVIASSPGYNAAPTVTTGGGFYSLQLPPGAYKLAANAPGYKGSININAVSGTVAAPDIVLVVDPDYDPDLIFSARSTDLTGSGAWPTVNPAGGSLVSMGGTAVQSFGGVQWEKNIADGPGYRFATFTDPIPVTGASIVLVAKPKRVPSNNWDSIVDVFYDRLVLGIRNDTGLVNVRRNGPAVFSGQAIPENQTTVLSLVVQPTGEYKVWANGVEIMNVTEASDMTALVPNVPGPFANAINVGRNNPDAWTTFNGFIGDVYLFKTAINESKRLALEASLLNKFVTNATLSYTIAATAGANGTITPAGNTSVVQGFDQTYTITANAGYVVADLLVDGVSVGAKTTYTFKEVAANHTIAATFVSLPPQTITASAGANGTITPSGAVSVAAGANQTFSILPNDGYKIASVLVDGVSVGVPGNYTFNFVVAPHTIAVTFEAISMDLPRTDQLHFSVVTDALPADTLPTGNWPSYVPSGQTLTVLSGTPTVEVSSGVKWQKNVATAPEFNGYGVGSSVSAPIPVTGSTIVLAAKPQPDSSLTGPWDSIVDIFYDRLVLGIKNDTGEVVARVNGTTVTSTELIPAGQPTILSLVVEADGSFKGYANGALVLTGTATPMTAWVPGAEPYMKFINVGRNNPDGWTAFNGNIGDVFVYKTALTSAQREKVEGILMTKFGAPQPTSYKWAGPNNGNWSTAANWNNAVPTAGNVATFSASASAGQTVQLDTDATVAGLIFNGVVNNTIASSSGSTLTIDGGVGAPAVFTEGGQHTISAKLDLPGGINKSGPGKLTLAGGLGGSSAALGGWGHATGPGIGLTVSGAGSELVLAGNSPLVPAKGTLVTGGGKLTITGTYTTADRDQIIGDAGKTGEVVLSGNGSWTHSGTGVLVIGNDQPTCVGKIVVNDNATLTRSGDPIWLAVGWGGGSTGIIEQNGGMVVPVQVAQAWRTGWGPGIMLGQWNNSPCHAVYSLNGGVLQTPSIGNVAWNSTLNVVVPPGNYGGSAILNLNGGILKASDSDLTDPDAIAEGTAHLIFNTTHTYVQAGGAKIDTAGFNNSVAVVLEHDPNGPAIDGGLTKIGQGTLTLLKSSTYTGPTKVQAGVLVCKQSDSLGSGPLDISNGAKVQLDYSGTRTVSKLTFNGGAELAPGTYGATGSGAVNINDTYFAGTGTVTVGGTVPPPVITSGSISMSGGTPSFMIQTTAGYRYRLVYKESITDAMWMPTGDWSAVSTGAPVTLNDSAAAGKSMRFYRIEAGL